MHKGSSPIGETYLQEVEKPVAHGPANDSRNDGQHKREQIVRVYLQSSSGTQQETETTLTRRRWPWFGFEEG